jgi:hypothetical protein
MMGTSVEIERPRSASTNDSCKFGFLSGTAAMDDDDMLAEAYRRVRLRYTPDEFGNLTLERVFQEVKVEAERLREAFQPTMSDH